MKVRIHAGKAALVLAWVAATECARAHDPYGLDEPPQGLLRPPVSVSVSAPGHRPSQAADAPDDASTTARPEGLRGDRVLMGPDPVDFSGLMSRTFSRFDHPVRHWWDATHFHVGGDGMPAHGLMEGITSWQRQVPVPTYYFGTNDWKLPRRPVPAAQPLAITTNRFLQGAIALAANGIPIFNPANNRGEISALIGELDRWGGHCGRADDYHYHAAPLHLTNVLGNGLPIAFALDGYPIYGLVEPDGSVPTGLDAFRGHEGSLGYYHYHASTSMPYVNGGFHGEIVELLLTNGLGQVVSQAGAQPRVNPVRPSGTALAGAALKVFTNPAPDRFELYYSLPANAPATNSWRYALQRASNLVSVTYLDAAGLRTTNYPNWRPAPPRASTAEPLVTTPPAGTNLASGSTLRLAITASGAAPLSYQWMRDGNPLADDARIQGALSPQLVIVAASEPDSGEYSVRVSNAVGSTESPRVLVQAGLGRAATLGRATTVVTNLLPSGTRVAAVGTVASADGRTWTVPAATAFATGPRASDLFNEAVGFTPAGIAGVDVASVPVFEVDPDGEVVTGYLFADNYFELYVNGTLVAVDPVPFTPFNSAVVRFRARRPITYALRVVDWEENLGVGTELNGGNPNHPGDGGFVASFSDGTVTGPHWRAQSFYIAPLADPALVVDRADGTRDSSAAGVAGLPPGQAWAVHYPVPAQWASRTFDDTGWPMARAYTEAQAGVGNKPAYTRFPAQFASSGAALIWSSNLVLDNDVLLRFTAPAPSNASPSFLASTNVLWARPGEHLRMTVGATDPDLPAQALTFGLASAPAGAAIHPVTGLLEWTPSAAFAGTSNLFRVVVSDNGVPSRSASRDLVVMVRPSQPDVVVIVTDDHGWGDLGANGGPQVTPNLDRLGREGIRLGRFYVTPICSVTRSTLLTGRSPLRTGVNNGRGLALQEHVLPVAFRSAGYQTYMCGKWHLGGLYNTETNAFVAGALRPVIREGVEYQPQNRGWDVHYGEYTGAIGYQTHVSQETGQPDWWLNGQPITEAGWSTDLLADKAIELLRNRDPLRPVLLYLAFNAVHGPVSAPAELLAKHAAITDPKRRASVAALDQLDQAVGRVLAAIDADGNRDRTLVTFFGDNGGQQSTGGSNLPLRGDKGDLFEGGIRTPAAIRWPGVLPEGVTNHQQAVWVGDLFPTLCAATGVVASNNVPFDGVNVWPLLLHATNGPFDPARHRASPLVTGSSAGNAVFEVGLNGTNTTLFKYIRQRLPASSGGGFAQWLFDIAADPLETTDLVALPAHAPRVAAMAARIDAITAESYTPYFGVHPEPARAPAGTNVVLWAMATAYNKTVAFQWRRNGVPIPGATNRVLVDASVYATQLALANVTPQDAGTYDVVVTASTVGWPAALASKGALLSIDASQPPPGTPLPYDVLVGRPTDRSITLSLLAKTNLTAWVETGIAPGVYTRTHPVAAAKAGEPASFVLEGLQPDTRHHYRVWHDAGAGAVPGTTSSFMTARARGSAFTFVVEADPHNRDNEPAVWRQALTNMLADAPDFLVDLGDTFMEEKVGITNAYYLTQPGIADLHREVREGYFSITGHAMPTYLVNGNHEAELGWLLRILSITNNPAVWSAQARQRFFPVPVPAPGGFYSGSGSVDPSLRGPRDGYYAFEWGDALLVALDPFWYTNPKPGQGGWGWTLGEEQYRWLKATLEGTTARFRFVFLHHLVGGGLGNQSRGGLTYAPFFEWGGRNLDGSPGFATARPGWEAPIQDLLLRHGVQVVFHGHDHLFVKEELDANNDGVPDLIYQEVPQPSRALFGTNSAPAYGYTNRNSLVVGNSGHLRVRVTPAQAEIEYVRVFLPENETPGRTNRMVSHRYVVPARVTQPPVAAFPLPDTGQTNRHGAEVTGVDADYTRPGPSYADAGDGTVRDLVTGWVWQRVDGGEMTWQRAQAYAATNTLAGAAPGDWRLPTLDEVSTLLVYYRQNPALNTSFFASPSGTAADYWWTRDVSATDPTHVWVANAGGGVGPKPTSETLSAGGTLRYHARLIRAPLPPPIAPGARFGLAGNGVALDRTTGLSWTTADVGSATHWAAAIQLAEGLTFAGFNDWRLPDIRELLSISDESVANPSLDRAAFPGATPGRYWSSTTQNNRATNAWWVDFATGIASQGPKTNAYRVRAVRGGTQGSAPTNTPPVIAAVPDAVLRPGEALRVPWNATDAETPSAALRLALVSGPPGATLDPSTRLLQWRPPVLMETNRASFVVSATDAGAPPMSATATLGVTVLPLTTRPVAATLALPVPGVVLVVMGDPGPDYAVEASTNLVEWSLIHRWPAATPPFFWLDTNPVAPWRFYRVRAE